MAKDKKDLHAQSGEGRPEATLTELGLLALSGMDRTEANFLAIQSDLFGEDHPVPERDAPKSIDAILKSLAHRAHKLEVLSARVSNHIAGR